MSRVLRSGDTGDDVLALNTALLACGHAAVIRSDIFGPITEAAVRQFQASRRLVIDGIAGPRTMASLRAAVPAEMLPQASDYEFHTAGPDHPEGGHAELVDGWYQRARRVDAHPGRVGRAIVPRGVVVHTTDMMPDTFNGLVAAWHREAGVGAAAHFIIGRDPAQGVVQMIPTTRNGNHAGGARHGNFVTVGGTLWHPNLWTIGIEVHTAGRLGRQNTDGLWRHPDSKRLIPREEVYFDERGIGWHSPTTYQLDELKLLLDAIKPTLVAMPEHTAIQPNGTYIANGVAPWAEAPTPWLVGHVSLDPTNKTDPGPEIMAWLRAYAAR